MNKNFIYIGGGVLAVGLLLFFTTSSNAQESLPADPPIEDALQDITVTGLDGTYDYKRISGVWFTKKKVSSTWIKMKDNLSAANYAAAIQKLDNYVANGGK